MDLAEHSYSLSETFILGKIFNILNCIDCMFCIFMTTSHPIVIPTNFWNVY